MGPEPLLFPLALLGILGLLASCTFVIRAHGKTWLSIVLAGGVGFAVWTAQGGNSNGNLLVYIANFLIPLGIYTLVISALLAFGSLLLLPFKPQLAKVVKKLRLLGLFSRS